MPEQYLPAELQEAFALHLKASQRRDELLCRAQTLQQAGDARGARVLTHEARTIQRWLTALEGGFREGRRLS